MTDYQKLEDHFRSIAHLSHAESILGWDHSTIMPNGGQQDRSACLTELGVIKRKMITKPELLDWVDSAKQDASLNNWQKANVREIDRLLQTTHQITDDLAKAKSQACSKSEFAWRSLRAENNWKDFAPLLKEVIALSLEEAQQRASHTGRSPYDALIDLYEPGQTTTSIEKTFSQLRDFLQPFIPVVLEKQKSQSVIPLQGPFAVEHQKNLGLEIMQHIGFDFNHGRLDVSHHPFCGGVPTDVRITTRYDENDFQSSLMGVIHETGHASYEQGLPKDWITQPVGHARSTGMHESQSLLFEMQVSRSKAFFDFATPIMQKHLGNNTQPANMLSAENLYALSTRVEPGLIRVDADEVCYPMHIILRFEIEKALLAQEITVDDLPEIWHEKMQAYLGLSTLGNDKDGCMQDIHWSYGALGYFPTYTLGAMAAAQLFQSACKKHPNIPDEIAKGQFSTIRTWLAHNIWLQASLQNTDDLMIAATGKPLQASFFIEHLQTRYNGA
ncbi:MAG: carboxypeptidase M32 [Deltaproteobacteria bacterium]|nr:carboxypeptidase M32 [Deltaproteobacteria bacterium]